MADRFSTRLGGEVRRWVRDGLVTAEQAERILGRYPTSPAWFTRPIAIFALIGGAFIAAGLALVIAHNWNEIPRWVKLGAVVILMVAAHGGGLRLRDRGYSKLGEGILVVGGSLLLVGIALIGQIYNLSGRPADAILLWWALLLPAAYALPSVALVVLGYAGALHWYWALAFDRASWLGAELWPHWVLVPVAFAAAGLILFSLGVVHGDAEYRRVRQFLEQLGLLVLVGALLPLGFLQREPTLASAGPWPVMLPALLGLAFVAVAAASYRLPHDGASVRAGLGALLLVMLFYLLALTAAVGVRAPGAAFRALGYANWALVFVASLALILYGARWNRTAWINWGVVFLGAHALARYVDLFGTMLQTSLLFFTTGVFVLLLGWGLERLRRRMTAQAVAQRRSA